MGVAAKKAPRYAMRVPGNNLLLRCLCGAISLMPQAENKQQVTYLLRLYDLQDSYPTWHCYGGA
jgi:hypothetical protein